MDKRKKGHKEIFIPKGSRKIHIGDEIWYWRSTAGSVVITAPNGKKYKHSCHVVIGCIWNDWERGIYKGYSHITPSIVKKYIEEHIV